MSTLDLGANTLNRVLNMCSIRSLRYQLVVCGLVSLGLAGCSGSKNNSVSSTTGWKYKDPNYGGFEVVEGYKQETGPGLVFIEGGTVIMGLPLIHI